MRVSLFFATALACGFVGQAAVAGPVSLKAGAPPVRVGQDKAACAEQAELPWCVTAQSQAEPEAASWTADQVQALQKGLTERFNYSYDPEKPWRSSYAKAAAGKSWSDDCDGLVFTMFDAMARQHFPKSKMWRAVVTPKKSAGFVKHMVGIVEVEGRYFVVGDTNHQDGIYPLRSAEFSVDLVSQVSAGPLWRQVDANASLLTQVSN